MERIIHKGIIKSVERGRLLVEIVSDSACASCKAKGACGASESVEKIVEVECNDSDSYQPLEEVTLAISQSTGFLVVFLAYVLPVIILTLSLILLNLREVSDNISGLVALGEVVIYFFILFLFRTKLSKKIKIDLLK